jgi:radical SAM protein with 4Fe4S-binding SPASM domain
LKHFGLSYVGISLDGVEATHDRFRGQTGAFAAAMEGVRHCQEAGIKVGLRFTINKHNYQEIPAIFDLIESHDIPRVCFYHLVYAGRGSRLVEAALSHAETRAEEVLQLLRMNEGNNSGRGIGCVSWDGQVHADQFWRHYTFGNVQDRPFSQIWTDLSNPLMAQLKDKKRHVTGRCATCRWLDTCGGNFRVRAEALTGDLWAPDPDCYLTDAEIA